MQNTCLTYSVSEVSALLGVSIGKAYQLIRDNAIPNIKIGGRYVVPCEAFHSWINSACQGGDNN